MPSLISQLESILFVASKPLTIAQLAKATGATSDRVRDTIETIKMKFNNDESGIRLLESEDTVQLATHPENSDVIEGFMKDEIAGELTKAQLETLTVIAYRGPVTRPEIEQIRGVNCAVIIRNLEIRGLVEEREDAQKLMPAYTVTTEALRHLGIDSVAQLPEYTILSQHEFIEQKLRPVGESEE